jgi:hypothetical protein
MKTITKVHVLALSLAAFAALAADPSAQFFENDDVKVFRALEKAHVKAKSHEHKVNRIMIYVQAGRQHFEYQDGRPAATFDWKAGQVEWSKADGFHSPEVTGDDSFNIIEVELKKPAPAKAAARKHDVLKADSKHYKLEFENDQVRVLRVKLDAHAKAAKTERSGNVVTVFLGGTRAGQAVWETPGPGQLEAGDQALEAIVVELKS